MHLANYDPNKRGGGWTFSRYLVEAFGQTDYDKAKIYFIASASMVQRDEVKRAKADGKKIVLRVDNAIRNSRNRNTGMTRLKDFAEWADIVIYQSEWAKKFLYPFTRVDGPVILNGVDLDKFKRTEHKDNDYLYVRSSRDEGKQWIMAWYWWVNHPGRLSIVGAFSPENLEYNFDFYNSEMYTFLGEQPDLVDVFRNHKYFLYTYLNDACSNTLLEARASGCEIVDVYGMLRTGGAPEIMAMPYEDLNVDRMISQYQEILK